MPMMVQISVKPMVITRYGRMKRVERGAAHAIRGDWGRRHLSCL